MADFASPPIRQRQLILRYLFDQLSNRIGNYIHPHRSERFVLALACGAGQVR